MAASSYAYLRASPTDRNRVIEIVKMSFAEGRLTKPELDLRIGQALASRYFPELMALIADLPAGHLARLPWHSTDFAPMRLNRLAVAALACAFAGPVTAGVSMIPAIVVGHVARRQVRQTGERGAAAADAAVLLGWLSLLIVAVIAIAAALPV